MQRVHRALGILPVEQQEVLNRLFPLAEHIDDVLRQLPAQEGGHGRQFRADVLQESAEEIGIERFLRQQELLVLFRREGGEELEVGAGVFGHAGQGAGDALEFPQRAQAGEQRRDGLFAPVGARVLGGDGGAVGEDDGGVDFAFGDDFFELAVLFLGCRGDDGARCGLGFEDGGDVGFFALEDVVVRDEVGEDETEEAVRTGGVERAVAEPAGGVDGGEGAEVEVGGDDHVKGDVVLRWS